MRPISPRLTGNTVTIQKMSFTQDAAGGRMTNLGAASLPIRCSVQPTNADEVSDHLRDEAQTFYTVFFSPDPGIDIRDVINWLDPNPDKVLFALAKEMNVAGISNTIEVLCGERT